MKIHASRLMYALFCLLIGASVGCSKSGEGPKTEKDLVLLEVNGHSLRQSDYDLRLKTRLRLLEIALPKVEFKRSRENAEMSIRAGLADEFLQQTLLETAANDFFRTNQVPPSLRSGVEKAARTEVLGTFSAMNGSNKVTFAEMTASLPERERACFVASVEGQVAVETFCRIAYSNEWMLSEAAVQRGLTNLVTYNQHVQATNRVAFAFATNVWKQALGGSDFGQLADKYSQEVDKKPGGDMGECGKVDFEDDDETWAAISALKEGGITPPLMTFNGIEIFKLIKKVPATESNSKEDAVHLARILFRRAVEVQDYTPESFRKEMESANRSKRMRQTLVAEWKRATVQFPNGQEVLPPLKWSRMPGFPKGSSKKVPASQIVPAKQQKPEKAEESKK